MTKVEKLCLAYEAFGRAIEAIPGDKASRLAKSSLGVRAFIAGAMSQTPKPTPSQIAAGLEQGWRETPILIQGFADEWRVKAAEAWLTATNGAIPEFLIKDQERMQKILTRGRIRTEAEFYRVRHESDLMEGQPHKAHELQQLYSLTGEYESR